MSAEDSIFAAYILTGLMVALLCIATWVRARRVRHAIAVQERSTRP